MTTAAEIKHLQDNGLYSAAQEHDACGVGFVAHIKGVKSHDIVKNALKILENLDHRGAVGADKLMGDGAGILIQLPDALYREEMAAQGVTLPPPGEYGVGMVFLPKEHASRLACEQELERAVKAEGQVLLGWRDVPVNRDMPMSPTVREKEPILRQIFIGRGNDVIVQDALERKLYVIRKTASAHIQALKLKHSKEYYVPSMSSRTVIYKGLLLADQVGTYYLDLKDPRCVSALGLVHQRFSTNTFPEWPLAHPYRYVAHNGEINTVKGNYNWMKAREGVMSSPVLGADLQKLYPISFPGPVRHRHLRQLPGTADHGRLPDQPGRDDDDSRALGAAHHHGRAPPRVLRIPRRHAGAVGRPGLHRVHRWPPDRRHAGPQRPAPVALLHHRRRPGHHGLRVRRAAVPREQDRAQVAPAARQDVPDRPGAGPHDRRRRAQGQPGQQQALQAVDREPAHPPGRCAGRRRARQRRPSPKATCWTASRPLASPRKTSSS